MGWAYGVGSTLTLLNIKMVQSCGLECYCSPRSNSCHFYRALCKHIHKWFLQQITELHRLIFICIYVTCFCLFCFVFHFRPMCCLCSVNTHNVMNHLCILIGDVTSQSDIELSPVTKINHPGYVCVCALNTRGVR